jgi:Carboxypeptidase regulatory-like domain
MAQKLGWLVLVAALALPAAAGELGSVAGYVKNSAGVPQMGAMVVVYGSNHLSKTIFTDARGFYSASGLATGVYEVQVTAPSFLPTLRENVQMRSGAKVLVNLTLNTLFEALQLVPARRAQKDEEDDWKWTLRSMANRPVLRLVDNGPFVVVSDSDKDSERRLKARVMFMAGADAEGLSSTAGMTTAFNLERSVFSAGTLSLAGDVYGTAANLPGAVVSAAYSRRGPDGSDSRVTLTARRFSTPELAAHDMALQALALSVSNTFSLSDFANLSVGAELQSIQLAERATALHPFVTATFHLSPNSVLEYRYATFEPNTREAKGFDSAPADLSESGPRFSMANWGPVMERAHHHELSYSHRRGRDSVQIAAYSDKIQDPMLSGTGVAPLQTGSLLPDMFAGTFRVTGSSFDAHGMRFVYERKLTPTVSATLDYAFGGVLDIAPFEALSDVRDSMSLQQRHAVAYKMSGVVPRCKTKWIASYRWTSGPALTPVDMFNAGPGQTDPYLSFFVRQPLPGSDFMSGHMEALIDVRNLLAQGYVPVVGQDGRTLYLVQSARTLRGGLSFTF